MIRNLLKFRFSTEMQLRWRQYNGMVEFLVPDYETRGSIIYIIDDEVTFSQLTQRQLFTQYEFKFPKGVQDSKPISSILINEEKPVSIEVHFRGEAYKLLNRAAQPDQKVLLQALLSPNTIFGHTLAIQSIKNYKQTLTDYYLKLQGQAYLRSKGLNMKSKLTADMKEQTITYLGMLNQTPYQSQISECLEEYEKIGNKILFTQLRIEQMHNEADRLLALYRLGAITLTAVHLGSFGYMIFGVQWLGWDIIEPLTFSVGTIYTLLGLRFYRKFRKDRNHQSIQQSLRNWVLRPSRRIKLKELKLKLSQEEGEQKYVAQKIKLLQNRLVPISTLPANL